MVGYPSGQRGQTVNLLAYAFSGSNPEPTTTSFHKEKSGFSQINQWFSPHRCFRLVRFGAFAVFFVPFQNDAHKYSKRIANSNWPRCGLFSLPGTNKVRPAHGSGQ